MQMDRAIGTRQGAMAGGIRTAEPAIASALQHVSRRQMRPRLQPAFSFSPIESLRHIAERVRAGLNLEPD